MNGADNVVNCKKVMWAGTKHEFRKMIIKAKKDAPSRFITMPRNEGNNNSLENLLKGLGLILKINTAALWSLRSKILQAPK